MASLDAMSVYLELLDLKKDSLRKLILMLALEWKHLDEHLDSIQDSSDLGQKLADLEVKHRVLRSEQESLAERNRELDLVRESLKAQLEELDCRKLNFRSFQLAQIEELNMREEKLEASREWGVVERAKEFEEREEMLNEQKKSMQVLLERIEREKENLVNIEKSVGKKLNVVGLRERQCENKYTEIDAIQEFVLGRVKEPDSREEKIGLREEKIEALHKTNDQRWKEHEIVLQDRSNILDSVGEILERKAKELGDKEKQIELREMQIKAIPFNEEKLKELEIKVKEGYRVLDSVRDLIEKLAKELNLGQRQVAISKFLGLRERLYDHIRELVRKGQHVIAIRYVCKFEIKDEFPPGSLVNGYITHLEDAVEKIRKEGLYSFKAQETATRKELNAFKELIKCIKLHKLDSEYAPESIEARVEQLQRQKTDLERFAWCPPTKTQSLQIYSSPKREKHSKKRKGIEHANNVQITRDCSAENLHPDDIPQLLYEHRSLSPVPAPHYRMSPFCLVGCTDPAYMGQCFSGALIQGGFSSSGVDLDTNVEFPLLHGWSSTWP